MIGNPLCPMLNRHNAECSNWRCGFHCGLIYGLLDERIGDIFYVGSTVQSPGTRYSGHLGANRLYNFREAWIMSILADGSLPIFLPLEDVETNCIQELHHIEHEIARELRIQGYTAMCDGRGPALRLYKSLCPISQNSEVYWDLKKHAVAEYLDRVTEHAHIQQWLREL